MHDDHNDHNHHRDGASVHPAGAHWTWLAAGLAAIAILTQRRARLWLGVRLVDLGLRLQEDKATRDVEAALRAWGREMRRRRAANGTPMI